LVTLRPAHDQSPPNGGLERHNASLFGVVTTVDSPLFPSYPIQYNDGTLPPEWIDSVDRSNLNDDRTTYAITSTPSQESFSSHIAE